MFSPLRRILVLMPCLLALTSMTAVSVAQQLCSGTTPCVTTWHNDLNRTGWQQDETALSPSTVSPPKAFGLLYQWTVSGSVYAQPLAISEVPVSGCTPPNCPNVVFVATEQDMLYAFNAASSAGNQPKAQPAALHAFCATAGAQNGPCPTALTEIYSSRSLATLLGPSGPFPTPTVFDGQVYVGTNKFVNVFGLCSTQPNGQCEP